MCFDVFGAGKPRLSRSARPQGSLWAWDSRPLSSVGHIIEPFVSMVLGLCVASYVVKLRHNYHMSGAR